MCPFCLIFQIYWHEIVYLPSDIVYIRFFTYFCRLVCTYTRNHKFYLFMTPTPPSLFIQMVAYDRHCSASCFHPLTVCLGDHTISHPAQSLFILFNNYVGLQCIYVHLNLFIWSVLG